jgi:hypothetical protein
MDMEFDKATSLYRAGNLAVSTGLDQKLLATAYLRLDFEKNLDLVYYEGVPSLLEFLKTCTAPEHICLGGFVDHGKGWEFCGLSWVFDRQQLGTGHWKAETGFAFFRHCAKPSEKVRIGQLMVEALFETFNISSLFGTTPAPNRAALKYARAVGFNVCGPIPNFVSFEGALADVYISNLTKQEWQARKQPRPLGAAA